MGPERGHHLRDLRRLIVWLLLGLVVGAALGALSTWFLMRRTARTATAAASGAIPAPPVRASPPPEPEPVGPAPSNDDVRQALDATRGLLDELEKRYQQPPGEAAPKAPRRKAEREDRG